MHTLRRHALAGVAILFALAGCDGFSCSGQGFEVGNEPTIDQASVIDPAIELRVTREGSELMMSSGPQLLAGLLGEGDPDPEGWIDASSIVNDVLQENAPSLFGLGMVDVVAAAKLPNPDGLLIEFLQDPDRVHVEIDELWLRVEGTVTSSDGGACRMRGDIEPGTTRRRMFTVRDISVDIELATTPDGTFDIQTRIISMDLVESGITMATRPDDPDFFCLLDQCQADCQPCRDLCETASLATDVADALAGAFDSLMASMIELMVNTILGQVESLGGRVHPALVLGSLLDDVYDSEHLAFALQATRTGESFEVLPRLDRFGPAGDLEVRLALGIEADAVHPCVPPTTGDPSFSSSPLDGIPPTADDAELALGLPAGFVDELVWSLYRSGALCLQIDAATVADLTRGAIDLDAGLLSLLLPGLEELAPADAPLLITLMPTLEPADFPVVSFGPATGDATAPSIRATLPNTNIGLYAAIDDVYVRLFAVEADIDATVTPTVGADGELGVGIEDIAITNLRETYDELFADVELQSLLEFVVELVTRVLVGNDISIALPLDTLVEQLLGVPLTVEVADFALAGDASDWLALSVGVSAADSGQGGSAGTAVETEVVGFTHGGTLTHPRGSPLRLELAHDGRDVQWRLDGLAWSGFTRGAEITIDSALLEAPGHHRLEIRARESGRVRTLDRSPLALQVEVVEAAANASVPETAHDAPADGGCSVASASDAQPVELPWLPAVLGLLTGALLIRRSLGDSGDTPPRRHPGRGAMLIMLTAALALLAGGCDEEKASTELACTSDRDCSQGQYCGCDGLCTFPTPCLTSADCCGGRACLDGVCERSFECRADGDCASGFTCSDCQCQRQSCASAQDCPAPLTCGASGRCEPTGHVPCQASCGDDEVCIVERDTCISRMNICPSLSCPAGQLAVLDPSGGLLGEACTFDDLGCGCFDAPPLSPPEPGSWVSALELGGVVMAAAYEARYGDLMLIETDGQLSVTSMEFVDGVPDARPTADPSGPRDGIGAPGDDVGRYASAVVTPAGALAIASRLSGDEGALRLAHRPAGSTSWTRMTVDDAGDAGYFADAASLPDGRIVVAYQANDPTGASSMLRVAVSTTPTPGSSSDFVISNVEVLPLAEPVEVCGGACSGDEVCLAETEQCARPDPPSACAESCALGRTCVDGACEATIAATDGGDIVDGTGVDPDAVVLGDGTLAVAFYRASAGELAIATGPPSGPFETAVIDAGENRAGFGPTDVGRGVSAALASTGDVHLAYLDAVSGALHYRTWSPAAAEVGAREIVSLGASGNPPRRVGGITLALGPSDVPRVAWQDTREGTLWFSQRDADGTWRESSADAVDVSGFSPSFADASASVVGFARIRPGSGNSSPSREVAFVRLP